MAVVNACFVKDTDELIVCVRNNYPVLVIKDNALITWVKEKCEHDKELQHKIKEAKKNGKIGIAGVGVSIGLAIFAATCPLSWAADLAVCIGALGVGTFGMFKLITGLGKRLAAAIGSEIQEYKWIKGEQGAVILYKYKGINAFDPKTDSIATQASEEA